VPTHAAKQTAGGAPRWTSAPKTEAHTAMIEPIERSIAPEAMMPVRPSPARTVGAQLDAAVSMTRPNDPPSSRMAQIQARSAALPARRNAARGAGGRETRSVALRSVPSRSSETGRRVNHVLERPIIARETRRDAAAKKHVHGVRELEQLRQVARNDQDRRPPPSNAPEVGMDLRARPRRPRPRVGSQATRTDGSRRSQRPARLFADSLR
jgi:hypothetical protein